MQNLKPLIAYQELDIGLLKAQRELKKNADLEKLSKSKDEFNAAKKAVADSEIAASEVVAFYENVKSAHAELEKKALSLMNELESIEQDDVEKRQAVISQIESVRDKLSQLENKMVEAAKKSKKVIAKWREAQEHGKKMKDLHGKFKERIELFEQEKKPQIEAMQAQLVTLKKGVEAKLLEQYSALWANGKIPPLAESKSADGGKSYTCLGCGIGISQASKSQLLESGFSNCDSCRRMIYKV